MNRTSGRNIFHGPEKKFQRHIAQYLLRTHHYAVLEQSEITDTEYYFAEDYLIAFIKATQPDTFKALEEDYGTDARGEIFRALKEEVCHTPLWVIIRHGLKVRGLEFKLYYPRPRSSESSAVFGYEQNRLCLKDELVIKQGKRPDLTLFLNGLPIITMEVKHEKNQTVHDAVKQYADRDHSDLIFQLPFLHIAADTSDVMVATDPRGEKNFRWFNTGLTNQPITEGEYPIEFLYRDVLSKDTILEALSFFLVYVPRREAIEDKPERPAYTVFPRYHQSRMVRRVADAALTRFAEKGELGKKYLIDHSAGSGKTLSICWLADRLHSLYRPGTNEKMLDMIFILTDRRDLDKNVRDEIENFVHLKDVVAIAKKSSDLEDYIRRTKAPIVVTTQQKFEWILDQIEQDPALKKLRVAFLIDEAHRSQEGKMGVAIRVPFRKPDEPDAEDAEGEADPEEEVPRIIRAHDSNQLFVAFTATPSPATLQLFGEPFDTYSEAEAIAEGYIVDVARSIISYKTLYNLHCPFVPPLEEEERLYPKGVVAKVLKSVAYQDEELIQYKAEVMLRIFDEQIKQLVGNKAKAMIVATSRLAGLRYCQILKDKLRERGADYKVLYAFSDFVHPETNESITETALNGLSPGELIEDRFEGDDYRLMVVASKFQTGFDQPLLAGMFLDKAVVDRNAVQTVSRLNRYHEGKGTVVVVDFTNNAQAIIRAFQKYRKGTPFEAEEPDGEQCVRYYQKILSAGIFTQEDAERIVNLLAEKKDAALQLTVNALRTRFTERLPNKEERREFVHLMETFVKSFHFLMCFFQYPRELGVFAAFAEYVGPQLIKQGSVSDLMKQVRQTQVVKASVQYKGEVTISGEVKLKKGRKGGEGLAEKKVSVQDMIEQIRQQFPISDEEALIIREVTEEKMEDNGILSVIRANISDEPYLFGTFKGDVDQSIQDSYEERGRLDELGDPNYIGSGGIFDIMALSVVRYGIDVA
jgi:type I restriction enzyme R subunit